MKKTQSIIKKGLNVNVRAFKEGKKNFNNPKKEVEELANKRISICQGCEYYEVEPIESFKVFDERIPLASERSCFDCGCLLSYKIRQSIKTCKKWQ